MGHVSYQAILKISVRRKMLSTVGDLRCNGVVERLIYTVKAKRMTMSFIEPKPSLNSAIDKIIWNLRSTKQPSIGCTTFLKHFNRSPKNLWKSQVSQTIDLDKRKSIKAKSRANDRRANDDTENGYLVETKSDNKSCESDPTDKSIPVSSRASQSNPVTQGGNSFRTIVNREKNNKF